MASPRFPAQRRRQATIGRLGVEEVEAFGDDVGRGKTTLLDQVVEPIIEHRGLAVTRRGDWRGFPRGPDRGCPYDCQRSPRGTCFEEDQRRTDAPILLARATATEPPSQDGTQPTEPSLRAEVASRAIAPPRSLDIVSTENPDYPAIELREADDPDLRVVAELLDVLAG